MRGSIPREGIRGARLSGDDGEGIRVDTLRSMVLDGERAGEGGRMMISAVGGMESLESLGRVLEYIKEGEFL